LIVSSQKLILLSGILKIPAKSERTRNTILLRLPQWTDRENAAFQIPLIKRGSMLYIVFSSSIKIQISANRIKRSKGVLQSP
jgi:hypothetical protein